MHINNDLQLMIWSEQTEGCGEDAPPLLIANDKANVVGVFDGMGGAGASVCDSKYGTGHTKAYVASRIVKDTVSSYMDEKFNSDNPSINENEIKELIVQRLMSEQNDYPATFSSKLRSKLVRDYPTTIALVVMTQHDDAISIDSYWAGDSRCYVWTQRGLFQISVDDITDGGDPLDNLHNDAPMSNCISADEDFHINHNHYMLPCEPMAIIAATDGCFGYFSTPMHFEYVLKECLQSANNIDEWRDKLNSTIQEVTGDDVSLSLIAVGYDNFHSFKQLMYSPVEGMRRIHKLELMMSDLQRELNIVNKKYKQWIDTSWTKYKSKYLMYLNNSIE